MAYWIPDNIIAKTLRIELINTKFLVIDLWMFVHLIGGGLLNYITKDWRKALAIIIFWEIIEVLLWEKLIIPETTINIIWDVIIGMAGYLIFKKYIFKT